eukprot:jgi/Antlo1/64/1257
MAEDPLITPVEEEILQFACQDTHAASLSQSTLLKTYSPFAYIDVLRQAGKKNHALAMLQKIIGPKLRKTVALEIIATYIYFGDLHGALERYQGFTVKSPELDRLRLFLELELHASNDTCGDPSCVKNKEKMISLLRKSFDTNLFHVLLDYMYACCSRKGCVGSGCLLDMLDSLMFVEEAEYARKLDIHECAELRRFFVGQHIERQRIMCNPFLPEKEILAYCTKYPDDLELLSHVAERRWLGFLRRDRRLGKIRNASVDFWTKQSFPKKRPIKIKLFGSSVSKIPKTGCLYFRFHEQDD